MAEPEAKSDVVFEDPPTPVHGRYNWSEIAAKVRRKPGKWAKVFEDDRVSLATSIRGGSVVALLPTKGFVVRTVNNKPGPPRTCTMYLKYDPARDHDRK